MKITSDINLKLFRLNNKFKLNKDSNYKSITFSARKLSIASLDELESFATYCKNFISLAKYIPHFNMELFIKNFNKSKFKIKYNSKIGNGLYQERKAIKLMIDSKNSIYHELFHLSSSQTNLKNKEYRSGLSVEGAV